MQDPEATTLWDATSWSLVERAAGHGKPAETNHAWVRLIDRYREPVTRGVRRILRGHPATDEILHEFPGYLLTHELLPKADRERGRFRCYLQGVLRRFVLDALRKRDPRGASDLAASDLPAPAAQTADDEDEAAWADTVLSNATQRYIEGGTRDAEVLLRFHGVGPFEESSDRETLCAEFDLTRNALNQSLHRGRQELRRLILEEVRDTVRGPGELHEEMTMVIARLMAARPGLIQEAGPA